MSYRNTMSSRSVVLSACTLFTLVVLYFIFQMPHQSIRTATFRDAIANSIHNETLGFEKILVLNLPSRTDRRDSLTLAAAFTGLKIDRIDGVRGEDVSKKTWPEGVDKLNGMGNIGSWRGHINVMERIVAEGWQSALVMEDDVDWDMRIKDQMVDVSLAVHLFDDFYGTFGGGADQLEHKDIYVEDRSTVASSEELNPYDHGWDVLWLGHCGTHFPSKDDAPSIPLTRVILPNDITVPQPHHQSFGWGRDDLIHHYPNHTRVFHHTAENVCSLAYAVTQRAARQILYHMSLDKLSGPFDIAIRNFCDGFEDGPVRRCWTVQPTLFDHHRAKGSDSGMSDINGGGGEDDGGGWRKEASTDNIRMPVRVNLGRLVEGLDAVDVRPDAS